MVVFTRRPSLFTPTPHSMLAEDAIKAAVKDLEKKRVSGNGAEAKAAMA